MIARYGAFCILYAALIISIISNALAVFFLMELLATCSFSIFSMSSMLIFASIAANATIDCSLMLLFNFCWLP